MHHHTEPPPLDPRSEAWVTAAFCDWLTSTGWDVRTGVAHCDVVARRDHLTLYAEVKGHTAAAGTDADTMYGQVLRRMTDVDDLHARFAVVVPTSAVQYALRVPARVRQLLRLEVFTVDVDGHVRLADHR